MILSLKAFLASDIKQLNMFLLLFEVSIKSIQFFPALLLDRINLIGDLIDLTLKI